MPMKTAKKCWAAKTEITDSTLQLINKRKEVSTKTLDHPSQEDLDEYSELLRFCQATTEKRQKKYENLAAEAELASAQNRMQDVYNSCQEKTMKSSSRIRSKQGNFIEPFEPLNINTEPPL